MKIGWSCIGIAVWAQVASGQQCSGDLNRDGAVTIDEIITSVNSALNGCSAIDHFADNRDGTITDNQTGVMWEKKVKQDGALDYANLQDADNYYPWAGRCSVDTEQLCQPTVAAAAACQAGVEGATTGCAECTSEEGTCSASSTVWTWVVALNTANFATRNDWRLAKRGELLSIIDASVGAPPFVDVAFQGASCGGACADVTSAACSCNAAGGYWSSATYVVADQAWAFAFNDGGEYRDVKTNLFYVRAVRGSS